MAHLIMQLYYKQSVNDFINTSYRNPILSYVLFCHDSRNTMKSGKYLYRVAMTSVSFRILEEYKKSQQHPCL